MAFIFYDTETTGTDTAFSQILQVAAILTDDDLVEIDSFDLRCRLLPHIVPSLTALLITGMTIDRVEAAPLSHYEMMLELRRRFLAWSANGAVFAGWNTLSFDEEMLRQGFYQSLLPIYLTNTNGNRRADIMRMTQAIRNIRPDAVAAGTSPEGKVSYRLGLTAAANSIVLDNAHDALADTRANLEMARLLKAKAPDLWDALIVNASKANAERLVASSELLFLAESRFGSTSGAVVAPLGPVGSSWAMFDLRVDPASFIAADEQELTRLLAASPRPVKRAPLNKQAALFRVDHAPDDIAGGRLPLELYQQRARMLRESPLVGIRITTLMTSAFDDAPEPQYVEQKIYRGFPSSADQGLMAQFHEVPWEDRRAIIGRIEDQRFRTLGMRVIAAGRSALLNADDRVRYEGFLRTRWTAGNDVPWHTVTKVEGEIASLSHDACEAHAEEIETLKRWLAAHRAVSIG